MTLWGIGHQGRYWEDIETGLVSKYYQSTL